MPDLTGAAVSLPARHGGAGGLEAPRLDRVFSHGRRDSAAMMAASSGWSRQLPRQAIISSVDIDSSQLGNLRRRAI